MEQPTPAPEGVDVDRARSVTLTWVDGHVSEFGLEELRRNCPCAECRGFRDRGRPAWSPLGPAGELRVDGAELVGNYGLQLHWNDGHDTGIYTWSLMLAWCSCPQCADPS